MSSSYSFFASASSTAYDRSLAFCFSASISMTEALFEVRLIDWRTPLISVAFKKNSYLSLGFPRMKFLLFSWSSTHTGFSTVIFNASRSDRSSFFSLVTARPCSSRIRRLAAPCLANLRSIEIFPPYCSCLYPSSSSFNKVTRTSAVPSWPSRTRSPILFPRCVTLADAPRQIWSAARIALFPLPFAPVMKFTRRQNRIVMLL
mmetsp:Transcript_20249/g.63647  ORF Transcript_20249/g.63647 Transcript_20249/m.63647 type:complete len:203 (-) Transcript_20249:160-768(-)